MPRSVGLTWPLKIVQSEAPILVCQGCCFLPVIGVDPQVERRARLADNRLGDGAASIAGQRPSAPPLLGGEVDVVG